MIEPEDIKIAKYITDKILLKFVDLTSIFFRAGPSKVFYEDLIRDYDQWREENDYDLKDRIKYLQKRKLIRLFYQGKKYYLELTKDGKAHLKKVYLRNLKIKRPKKWDGKFRMMIFDIPESERKKRDLLRCGLRRIGFKIVQRSAYIYPFECKKEVDLICKWYKTGKYKIYMLVDILEGEKKFLQYFLNRGILFDSDLRLRRKK